MVYLKTWSKWESVWCGSIVTNMFQIAAHKSECFSEYDFSGPTASREIRSNYLDSPWTSFHLYNHQIICFTVAVLQHSIKVSTGKRDLRLGKLRKSVGSFLIRCGLGWALGGLRMTIISWAYSEKTLKNIIFLPRFNISIKSAIPKHKTNDIRDKTSQSKRL